MMIAKRIRTSYFQSRPILAPLMAFFSLLVLFLDGCQTSESLTGGRNEYNTLAVGLAIPPPKFSDGVVVSGLNTPMAMQSDPDGKLWVLEKGGAVKIIVPNTNTTATFVTVPVDGNTERSLLGIAFDPNWQAEKYVYLHYSRSGQNRNWVTRFKVSAADPYKADPGETVLFHLSELTTSAYHNGGAMHFGKDGYLYLTTGDNRLTADGQNKDNLLGKMLRISKV